MLGLALLASDTLTTFLFMGAVVVSALVGGVIGALVSAAPRKGRTDLG
jgi:hypothetical protein